MKKNNWLDLILIGGLALIFNYLPFFVSGVPLHQQILSDAESHIAFLQIAMHPDAFSGDTILRNSITALPAGQALFAYALAWIPQHFKIDIFSWSVLVSLFSILLFVCGVYVLVLSTIKDRLAAFVIASFCIIPIHALGGSTFGFQALGYLPRDLALAAVILILPLYFRAVYREDSRLMVLVFFILGLTANFYLSVIANIALTLLFSEILRVRKLRFALIWCSAAFILGAIPTFIEFFLKDSRAAPIDLGLMRSYYSYLMATPFPQAIRQYLRRLIVYAVCVPLVYFFIIRKSRKSNQLLIRPWISLALASFILSVVGVYIETTTTYTKYLISRASLWFMFSSMIICFYGVRILMKRIAGARERFFTVLVVSILFLGQSNAPSIYKFLIASHGNASQKKEFHIAVAQLKDLAKEDEIILAPSSEFDDLAATVRTYSERGIYVCYKYGGVSIMDGLAAREFKTRFNELSAVFNNFDSKNLINFMKDKGIHFAFIPAHYCADNDNFLKSHLKVSSGHYLIVFADF